MGGDEAEFAQFGPQRRRDGGRHQPRILTHLVGGATAGDDGGDDRVRGAELQCGGPKVDAMPPAHRCQPVPARNHLGGRPRVIVGPAAREHTGIVRAAHDNRHPARHALRKQRVERACVQQRVSPGQQKDVRIGGVQRAQAGLDEIDAQAPGSDHTLLAHALQGDRGAGHRRVEAVAPVRPVRVGADVVDVGDVDAVEAEPFEAVLDRAPRTVGRIVELHLEGQAVHEAGALASRITDRHEQPADLGRKRERLPRAVAQRRPEAALGEAEPIQRRRVKMPDANIPCGIERRASLFVRKRREQIADRSAAAAERSRWGIAVHLMVSFRLRNRAPATRQSYLDTLGKFSRRFCHSPSSG